MKNCLKYSIIALVVLFFVSPLASAGEAASEIGSKYNKLDKEFASHMIGIAKKNKVENFDADITDEQAKLWDDFVKYTGLKTKGEKSHKKGQIIKFSQFVDSAWQIWSNTKDLKEKKK